MVPQFLFVTLGTTYRFRRMQGIFMQFTWFFSTPCSTDLTLIYPLKWNHTKIVKTIFLKKKIFLWKKSRCHRISAQLASNKLKEVHEGVLDETANIWCSHCTGKAATYLLLSVFIDTCSLCCVWYGTPCKNYLHIRLCDNLKFDASYLTQLTINNTFFKYTQNCFADNKFVKFVVWLLN